MIAHTEQEKTAAIYIPDNADLHDVLASLPPELERYADHARYLLHAISTKAWMDDVDRWGWARLDAKILRKYIPKTVLVLLKSFLVSQGVLRTAGYSAGKYSTGYRIARRFDGPPIRVLLTDARLSAKVLDWRDSYVVDVDPPPAEIIEQREPILRAMRRTLDKLSFTRSADKIVQALTAAEVKDRHVRYVRSVVQHGDHSGLKVCNFGRRVHSLVTRMSKAVRPFLTIDGAELVELDVANSQPLILAAAFRHPERWPTYLGGQHIGRAWPAGLDRSRVLDGDPSLSDEVDHFTHLCETGLLYEYLLDRGGFKDRDRVKKLLFRDVLFCDLDVSRQMTDVFASLWPELFNAVVSLKLTHGYAAVSMLLQRMESHIVIDGVCGRLVEELPGLDFLTVHDSALVVAGEGATVKRLMEEEFTRFGVSATVKAKTLVQDSVQGPRLKATVGNKADKKPP